MTYRKIRIVMRVAFFAILFLCSRLTAHAAGGLTITEIMFDPAGTDDKREWVEVRNTGPASLDLSGHFILTDGLASSKHSLAPQGSASIPAGGYAVIVQDVAGFKADFPSYAGLIFDSSWSGLTATTGKTIIIIDSQSAVLDSMTYDPTIGGANTGDSLQKADSGIWVAALPTPGAAPSAVSSSGEENASTGTGSGSGAGTGGDSGSGTAGTGTSGSGSVGGIEAGTGVVPVKRMPAPAPRMRADLSVPARAIAGIPVKISAKVYGYSDELRTFGVTHFALGDGAAHEGTGMESFSYAYAHPGTYVVTFQYRSNFFNGDPDIAARATIEVSPPGVTVSHVDSDGSIELSNPGEREADVSGWTLAPDGQMFAPNAFRLPAGTIVLPKQKILLSPAVTDFGPETASHARLMLPSGLSAEPLSEPAVAELAPVTVLSDVSYEAKDLVPELSVLNAPAASPPADAPKGASAQVSQKAGRSVWPFVLGALVLVAAAGGALYKLGIFEATDEPVPEESAVQGPPKVEAKGLSAETIRILGE